jgi:hypothetical protein
MSSARLAGLALLTAALCGCGTSDDERASSATVTRLLDAVEQGDGAAACEELTDSAEARLATSRGVPCEEAIRELELQPGRVRSATVSITAAQVDLVEGGSFFLDETSQGWKVSAAGCQPRPGQPYDCELEG